MLACNSKFASLRKIGVDMEDAIFNGMKIVFKDVERLVCVKHLSDRDKSKIGKLLAKTAQTGNDKVNSTKEIIADIYGKKYGKKYGAIYEYGLADAANATDFENKLNSLRISGHRYVQVSPNGFLESERRCL